MESKRRWATLHPTACKTPKTHIHIMKTLGVPVAQINREAHAHFHLIKSIVITRLFG